MSILYLGRSCRDVAALMPPPPLKLELPCSSRRITSLVRPPKKFLAIGLLLRGLFLSIAVLGLADRTALADDECGVARVGVGGETTSVTCDGSNYDPDVDGNIVYNLATKPGTGNENYKVYVRDLKGDKAITIDDALDSPHRYFFSSTDSNTAVDFSTNKPSAVALVYGGYGDFTVDVSGIELRARGSNQRGLRVWLDNDLDNRDWDSAAQRYRGYPRARALTLNVRDSELHTSSTAVGAHQDWNGSVSIDVRDTKIRTYGPNGAGIKAVHDQSGDMHIRAERVDIVTENGHGLLGWVYAEEDEEPNPYRGPSDMSLTAKDSRIEVAGGGCATWNLASSKCGGLFAYHKGSGEVEVLVENSRVEANDEAYGIWVNHGGWFDQSSGVPRAYDAAVGHDLDVDIDIIDSEIISTDEDAIKIDRRDGSRGKNKISVRNSVVEAGDGNFAINADGDTDIRIVDNGRIEGPVTATGALNVWIGNGRVIRNGEILRTVGASGAYDTTVSAAGVGSFALNRDHRYAARVALYESLPGLLLRLDAGAPMRHPEEPVWMRFGYGAGRGEAKRSPAGASYDYDRIEAKAGISRTWGDGWGGSMWLRRVQSEVKVDAPTGGSEVELHGVGAGVAAHWGQGGGLEYSGEFSWTDFDVDADSSRHGRLARNVGAKLLQGRLEAGYRMHPEDRLTLLPRTWLWHARAEIDDFTDAVGARVAYADESRSAAGLGLLAEVTQPEYSLYGSLDLEHLSGGEETAVGVSGERLMSESKRTRVLAELGGSRQGKRVTLHGGLRLADPGGRNQEVFASVSLTGHF